MYKLRHNCLINKIARDKSKSGLGGGKCENFNLKSLSKNYLQKLSLSVSFNIPPWTCGTSFFHLVLPRCKALERD